MQDGSLHVGENDWFTHKSQFTLPVLHFSVFSIGSLELLIGARSLSTRDSRLRPLLRRHDLDILAGCLPSPWSKTASLDAHARDLAALPRLTMAREYPLNEFLRSWRREGEKK